MGVLIYIVDDEPLLLELASAILEPLGYAIETYRDPETALQAFRLADPPPALIITDYMMHSMTGLEFAEACRQTRPQQKFLLVTGTVGPEVLRGSAVSSGRFLAKPYQANQLIDKVKAALTN